MRESIRRLVLGVLALAALRLAGGWTPGATPLYAGGMPWWAALSFALAAVVDTDMAA